MTPSPSARGDASGPDSGGSGPTILVVPAALTGGLLAGWVLRGAGFAAVESALVAGVSGLAVYACLNYVATRLSAG